MSKDEPNSRWAKGLASPQSFTHIRTSLRKEGLPPQELMMRFQVRWKIQVAFVFVLFLLRPTYAEPTPPQGERHLFKIHGVVTYRCYGGYGPQKTVDSRTKTPCDNQTTTKVLFDESVFLEIKAEPNPDNSKDLAGGWGKNVEFEGRKFTVALSLFKRIDILTKTPYRMTVVALDDEPSSRLSTFIVEAGKVRELNPFSVEYRSKGQPEEIVLNVSIQPQK